MDKNLFNEYPDIVNVKEMQKMLGIGRTLAYQLIKEKTIKSKKLNNKYKIQKQSIIKFFNELGEE
ncbi:MAG: helix-turn-helix domain-containing protein [Spirochaetales bacterium]